MLDVQADGVSVSAAEPVVITHIRVYAAVASHRDQQLHTVAAIAAALLFTTIITSLFLCYI